MKGLAIQVTSMGEHHVTTSKAVAKHVMQRNSAAPANGAARGKDHVAMVAAIEAGDVALADKLAAAHAAQIVQQIQSYIARGAASDIDLAGPGHR